MLVLFSLTVENALEISTCPLGFAACISKNLCLFRFSSGQNLITNSLGLLGDTYSDIWDALYLHDYYAPIKESHCVFEQSCITYKTICAHYQWTWCLFLSSKVCALVSPSRRTASSLVTDGESKHDGLRVSINQTERTPLMRRMRVLDKFLRFWG